MQIGIVGAGAMGSGIAQVAAQNGHRVVIVDNHRAALEKSKAGHQKILARLVEKGRLAEGEDHKIASRISYDSSLTELEGCGLVIEAIIEKLDIKQALFKHLEEVCGADAILASNTSSLSIASIAAACEKPERVLGIHFFNPAPLMPLVEIIPAITSDEAVVNKAKSLIDDWGKVTVLAKDTPGFIVNRVARPFYGEAVRIYEEGVADIATIDWALSSLGGFRMGPFTLMDFIGHDVNYAVTESVFTAFFYDPRYKPNFSQKRLVEAGLLGRKTGRGFYDYRDGAVQPEPNKNEELGQSIVNRVLAMLINEASDALHLGIASAKDIDLAMTKGVNYPKGLLAWADEIGLDTVLATLDGLYDEYREDRYRASVLLRRKVAKGEQFF
ncbi:3-hydroxyacyl-CoA dehydrogenase NAD-binding domain-containing protein [Croceimicrobium hydrocarbonivorans]|uniref:3-hydroxybutyryl-CoA dehydrogenase n=1 Tax=Croceimicrobium hydrocarbonivorans TaxID=2761580 RepID=A0A7H0VJ88_9FLAO|nr:3-hydroxyacyl-CoA dehydrogenase NAD-binding domain-containing protein [Croceimicrobium hydrocarbonivorans]QNR25786.1 3-hydroxybutyryl-CoA dehydrogenase [Croceimicrobium hydrocarbonivorans]